MRIVTWNIHSAVGIDGVRSAHRIADVLAALDADVIALQEVRSVPPFTDQPGTIARRLGMRLAFQANVRGLGFRFGNVVLTRGEILHAAPVRLPGAAEPRGVLVADIEFDGERVLLAATHLGLDASERVAQKEAIAAVLPRDAPVVLCGDFNESPERLGAIAERFTLAPPVASYPAAAPSVAIDLVLTSEHWRVERTRAIATGASDHLPVVADLVTAVGRASDASSRA